MPLRQLLEGWVDAERVPDCQVKGIQIDSRKIKPGDLYIGLKGEVTDGGKYIDDAISRGAPAALIDQQAVRDDGSLLSIRVPELRARTGLLADRFFGQPSAGLSVIGLTGTNGKTSCCQFVAEALDGLGVDCGFIGTLGYGRIGQLKESGNTTPDAVSVHRILADLKADGAAAVAMEVSSHGLEQGRVAGVRFDTAVFTNLSRDHLDYHGDMEQYGASKEKLFKMPGLENAVINVDDPFGRDLADRLRGKLAVYGYSLEARATEISASRLELGIDGGRAYIKSPWGEGIMRSALLGRFNLSNLLAVFTVLCLQGVAVQKALAAISRLGTVPGRMERFGGGGLPLVVVDYAHTPDALATALNTLRGICAGQLWCVFGCGGDRDTGKRAIMGEVAERLADRVVLTNDNPRKEEPTTIVEAIKEGMRKPLRVSVQLDRAEAIRQAVTEAVAGDIVLVAGKGHESYQETQGARTAFSDIEQVKQALNIKAIGLNQ